MEERNDIGMGNAPTPAPQMTPPTKAGSIPPHESVTARQAYNLVTDTVTGPNLRWKDNVLQACVILVCAVLGAAIGAFVLRGPQWMAGVLVGVFIGMVVGLFGSGIFLMIFRAVRHAKGKHE